MICWALPKSGKTFNHELHEGLEFIKTEEPQITQIVQIIKRIKTVSRRGVVLQGLAVKASC